MSRIAYTFRERAPAKKYSLGPTIRRLNLNRLSQASIGTIIFHVQAQLNERIKKLVFRFGKFGFEIEVLYRLNLLKLLKLLKYINQI